MQGKDEINWSDKRRSNNELLDELLSSDAPFGLRHEIGPWRNTWTGQGDHKRDTTGVIQAPSAVKPLIQRFHNQWDLSFVRSFFHSFVPSF